MYILLLDQTINSTVYIMTVAQYIDYDSRTGGTRAGKKSGHHFFVAFSKMKM